MRSAKIGVKEKKEGIMNLYAGKILKVDLTNKQITTEQLREDWIKQYWGCWGLAAKYFCELVSPEVEPFSPMNSLVIMTGPFAGTTAPTSARFCMVSKSPHTNTIFETNTGGAFAPELKFAGYDGVIITGKSDSLVFLQIKDDDVRIEDASSMQAKGIFETEKLLRDSIQSTRAKTLSIGPAGENLVPYACVGTESYHQMGRAGAGALFGNKNLKGIVCLGTGGVQVADMKAFSERVYYWKYKDVLTDANLWAKEDGTPLMIDVTNEMGIHPTRNFSLGVNKNHKALNADMIKKAQLSKRACAGCFIACRAFTHVNGAEVEGPEYETLTMCGSNCEINDMEQIIRYNRFCDDLGLDTMSSGNVVALAMDMTEKRRHDFNLTFAEPVDYLKVVKEIATLSTPRGRDLAMGAKKLAEKYNSQDLSTEIKGLEFPGYDPRGNYGMGLGYATSERGACHLRAFPLESKDCFDLEIMAKEVVERQNLNAIKFSMCFCDFWGSVNTEIMADLLTVGLGEQVTSKELDVAGERIWNLTRLYNNKAGFSKSDDSMPKKIMEQGLLNGPHKGRILRKEDFDKMLKKYYEFRGWDPKGHPLEAKLSELGLKQF